MSYVWDKNKLKNFIPIIFIIIGLSFTGISLAAKGMFDPFVLLAHILMAVFTFLFRRRGIVVLIILSFSLSLVAILGIKNYVISIKIMRTEALTPMIRKDARVFIRPAFFHLYPKDLIIYRLDDADDRDYIGELQKIDGDRLSIYRLGQKEYVQIPNSDVKGKVILIVNPKLSPPSASTPPAR